MPEALSAVAFAAVIRSNLPAFMTTPCTPRKVERMNGRKVLSVTGLKTFVLGCAASFLEGSRISLKCLWKASSMKASDGAWALLRPLPTLNMKPVMEGSTAVSQIWPMPRARLRSVSEPVDAAGPGPGPGDPARAFSLASVGPPGSMRPSAKAGTCFFWNVRIAARVAESQVPKTTNGGAAPPCTAGTLLSSCWISVTSAGLFVPPAPTERVMLPMLRSNEGGQGETLAESTLRRSCFQESGPGGAPTVGIRDFGDRLARQRPVLARRIADRHQGEGG